MTFKWLDHMSLFIDRTWELHGPVACKKPAQNHLNCCSYMHKGSLPGFPVVFPILGQRGRKNCHTLILYGTVKSQGSRLIFHYIYNF